MVTRTKIDSEIILEILYKTKNYKVLSKYNGRAALVWTDTNQPNVIYLWSGKSRPNITDSLDKAEEERPLNVYIENKNSFYFSSLPESLYAIGGELDNVFQIDYNTVYKVTDGNFKDAEKIRVSRNKNCCVSTYVAINYTNNNSRYNNYNDYEDYEDYCYGNSWNRNANRDLFTRQVNNAFKETNSKYDLNRNEYPSNSNSRIATVNIYNDDTVFLQSTYKNRIYNKKLRYWRNGHTITGVYIYIPKYGFYYMADTDGFFETRYNAIIGKKFFFNEGDFESSFQNKDEVDKKEGEILFNKGDKEPKRYYFVDGVMLKNVLDYKITYMEDSRLAKGQRLCYEKLSHMSEYPIIEITKGYKLQKEQNIIKDGKPFTGEINGLGFEKIYVVEGGNLIDTKSKIVNEKEDKSSVIQLPITTKNEDSEFNPNILNNTIKFLQEFESKIIEEESLSTNNDEILIERVDEKFETQSDEKFFNHLEKQLMTNQEVVEVIDEVLNESLTTPIMELVKCKNNIKVYEKHPYGKKALDFLDMTIDFVKEFFEENKR